MDNLIFLFKKLSGPWTGFLGPRPAKRWVGLVNFSTPKIDDIFLLSLTNFPTTFYFLHFETLILNHHLRAVAPMHDLYFEGHCHQSTSGLFLLVSAPPRAEEGDQRERGGRGDNGRPFLWPFFPSLISCLICRMFNESNEMHMRQEKMLIENLLQGIYIVKISKFMNYTFINHITCFFFFFCFLLLLYCYIMIFLQSPYDYMDSENSKFHIYRIVLKFLVHYYKTKHFII